MCIFEAAPIAGIQPTLMPSPELSVQLSHILSVHLPPHPPTAEYNPGSVYNLPPCRRAAEEHAESAGAGTTGLQLQTGYATVGSGQSTV